MTYLSEATPCPPLLLTPGQYPTFELDAPVHHHYGPLMIIDETVLSHICHCHLKFDSVRPFILVISFPTRLLSRVSLQPGGQFLVATTFFINDNNRPTYALITHPQTLKPPDMSSSRVPSGSTVPFTPKPGKRTSSSKYSLSEKEISKVC